MSCPICSKETAPKYRPFCSKHCADVDLGRWMSGQYAIPSENPDDADALAEAREEASNKDAADPEHAAPPHNGGRLH